MCEHDHALHTSLPVRRSSIVAKSCIQMVRLCDVVHEGLKSGTHQDAAQVCDNEVIEGKPDHKAVCDRS